MSEITNPGDIAEILANIDTDAQRLSELVSDMLEILHKRSWPGVIAILTEPTEKVVAFCGGTSLNLEDQNQHALLHCSHYGPAIAAAIVEVINAQAEDEG